MCFGFFICFLVCWIVIFVVVLFIVKVVVVCKMLVVLIINGVFLILGEVLLFLLCNFFKIFVLFLLRFLLVVLREVWFVKWFVVVWWNFIFDFLLFGCECKDFSDIVGYREGNFIFLLGVFFSEVNFLFFMVDVLLWWLFIWVFVIVVLEIIGVNFIIVISFSVLFWLI